MTKQQIIRQLKALKPRQKEYLHKVPDEAGLYVCVRPDGTKPFAFRYTSKIKGTRRLMVMDVEGMERPDSGQKDYAATLDGATASAIMLRQQVKKGKDPIEDALDRQKTDINSEIKKLKKKELTVELLCEWYVGYLYGKHTKARGYTPDERKAMSDAEREEMLRHSARSATGVHGSLKLHVYPVIGQMRASRVTADHVRLVADAIAKNGTLSQTNHVISFLGSAFSMGLSKGGKKGSYFRKMPDFKLTTNPAVGVDREADGLKRRKKERTLKLTEIARLWNEVGGACMSKQQSLALKFLLSSGQRVEEVLEAEWKEIDFDAGEWAIPMARRGKTAEKAQHDEPHVVPLEPVHIKILKSAKQLSGRSKYVFPAQDGGPRTSSSLNQSIRRYCVPQGISRREPFEKFTPRDCRRSFKTMARKAGIDSDSLAYLQGHGISGLLDEHYDRYGNILEKRLAMRTFTQALDVLTEVKATEDPEELRQLVLERFPPDNVVSIARSA